VPAARCPKPTCSELVADHGGFDGLLNGDDAITAKVIDAAMAAPTPLRVIAKYGIGLDSIDVKYATSKKIARCSSRRASTTPPWPSTRSG
jgi:lactate dehydrogenase-like 2-hydroxyacid dehydrogenase